MLSRYPHFDLISDFFKKKVGKGSKLVAPEKAHSETKDKSKITEFALALISGYIIIPPYSSNLYSQNSCSQVLILLEEIGKSM